MANVDSGKPMLRGLTPPVVPVPAVRPPIELSASSPEAFPGELTPVVTVEQSAALAAEGQRLEEPAASAEDRTAIAPTPIPREAVDNTNPTADAQILESLALSPAVPARAATLGTASYVDKSAQKPLAARILKRAQEPVSVSWLQLAGVVLASGLVGGLFSATLGGSPPQRQTATETKQAAPAAVAPPIEAAKAPQKPAPAPPAAVAAPAAPTQPVVAAKPRPRKKKVPKKAAGARLAKAPAKPAR